MINQIAPYLKFLLRSKNHYAVHSPFVYDLMTLCVYDGQKFPEYDKLTAYRRSLCRNHNEIDVTDFGAGSNVFKSNRRKISAIAKNAGIPARQARLLFRLTRYFKPDTVLEIGTSLGLATAALSLGNPDASIISLEGCPEIAAAAVKNLQALGLSNIAISIGEFSSLLRNMHNRVFDLIYFDGNHTKEATLQYFDLLLPTATNDSVWIFDDIHWSAGMESAWNVIKENPAVTVTIDTFQWGVVFFRKEQRKEHFVLRT